MLAQLNAVSIALPSCLAQCRTVSEFAPHRAAIEENYYKHQNQGLGAAACSDGNLPWKTDGKARKKLAFTGS
jgi:hypothetical protein